MPYLTLENILLSLDLEREANLSLEVEILSVRATLAFKFLDLERLEMIYLEFLVVDFWKVAS